MSRSYFAWDGAAKWPDRHEGSDFTIFLIQHGHFSTTAEFACQRFFTTVFWPGVPFEFDEREFGCTSFLIDPE